MRFTSGRRRPAPAIIIVSLIDILIVLLIFLMVTTTFRQQPAVKLTLPESAQARKTGADADTLLVTVSKEPPHFYLGERAVTLERLETEFRAQAAANTNLTVAIRPDKEAAVEHFFKVMDAARAARVRNVQALTREAVPGG
jgi:biopolymer transport protein ExbD